MNQSGNSANALAITAALLLSSFAAYAQDDDGGPLTQGEDAVYVRITYVKFNAGQRGDAMQIISEHFEPAGEKAGVDGPFAIHFQTGPWDAAFYWDMKGGMADLEWFRSEDSVKWMAALAKLEGGEEQAAALLAKYMSMIDVRQEEVGHYHDSGESDD